MVMVARWLPDYLPNVSALSTWWIDTTECWSVVGQNKMSCAVTGERNISKVSPGLG